MALLPAETLGRAVVADMIAGSRIKRIAFVHKQNFSLAVAVRNLKSLYKTPSCPFANDN